MKLDDVCFYSSEHFSKIADLDKEEVDSVCKGCRNKNYTSCGFYQGKIKQETIDQTFY